MFYIIWFMRNENNSSGELADSKDRINKNELLCQQIIAPSTLKKCQFFPNFVDVRKIPNFSNIHNQNSMTNAFHASEDNI